jgi:hypothetical protein
MLGTAWQLHISASSSTMISARSRWLMPLVINVLESNRVNCRCPHSILVNVHTGLEALRSPLKGGAVGPTHLLPLDRALCATPLPLRLRQVAWFTLTTPTLKHLQWTTVIPNRCRLARSGRKNLGVVGLLRWAPVRSRSHPLPLRLNVWTTASLQPLSPRALGLSTTLAPNCANFTRQKWFMSYSKDTARPLCAIRGG